jgi:hypothetical protein
MNTPVHAAGAFEPLPSSNASVGHLQTLTLLVPSMRLTARIAADLLQSAGLPARCKRPA